MTDPDVRWKQRFENFKKALDYLSYDMEIKNPDIFQRAGIIQFFEMTFELGWNVLKDYLEIQGFTDINTPRASIKKAFEIHLIENGQAWLQALEGRSLSSHTYDEEAMRELVEIIRKDYFPLLQKLDINMRNKEI